MSIVKKLYILFLGLSLLPILAVSFLAYVAVSNAITARIYENANALADRQKNNVETILQNGDALGNSIAVSYDLRQALDTYLTTHDRNRLTVLQNEVTAVRSRSPLLDVVDVSVLDTNNTVIASTTASNISTSITNPAADKITSVDIVPSTNKHIGQLEFWRRIVLDGRRLGTARVTVSASQLNGVAQDYAGLGSKGETLIAGKDAQENALFLTPTRFNQDATFSAAPKHLPFFTQDTVHAKAKDDANNNAIIVSRYINAPDWSLLLVLNAKEAFAPVESLRQILLLVDVIAAVIIIVSVTYFARLFTRPIVQLTRSTEKISRGDFTQKLPVTSKDEIAQLASSFNRMSDKLAQSYGELERKVAERTVQLNQKVQEVERARAKDEAIIGSMGEGMIITDSFGRVLLVNQIAADLMSLHPVFNKPLESAGYQLLDDRDQPLHFVNTPLYRVLQGRQKIVQDAVVRSGSSKRTLSIVASPVLQNNQLIGSIQIIRDITKEREIDRMKTEFISLASHQLRTPLSAIKWFLEMLLAGDAGDLNKEQHEFAQSAADSTERMIDLVNSLLNISRIESGRIMIEPVPTDLRELVNGIITDLKGKTEERHQMLAVSVHDQLPKINLDPRMIGQVYLNLLTNAIKYTPEGGEIAVFISLKGNEVISQVTDNGFGIPKAEQPRLFQKFFRAQNIAKAVPDGTGLGMYLVKAIIESSGGKIWFKSDEGKGTTFWFSLPLSGMKAKAGEVTLGE